MTRSARLALASGCLAAALGCTRATPANALLLCQDLVGQFTAKMECVQVQKEMVANHDARAIDAAVLRDTADGGATRHFAVVLLFLRPEDVDAYAKEKEGGALTSVQGRKGRVVVHGNKDALSLQEWAALERRLQAYR